MSDHGEIDVTATMLQSTVIKTELRARGAQRMPAASRYVFTVSGAAVPVGVRCPVHSDGLHGHDAHVV